MSSFTQFIVYLQNPVMSKSTDKCSKWVKVSNHMLFAELNLYKIIYRFYTNSNQSTTMQNHYKIVPKINTLITVFQQL